MKYDPVYVKKQNKTPRNQDTSQELYMYVFG